MARATGSCANCTPTVMLHSTTATATTRCWLWKGDVTPDELINVFLIYSLLPRPSQYRRVKVAATAAASAFAPSKMPLFRAFIQFSPEKCRPSAAGLLPSPTIVSVTG